MTHEFYGTGHFGVFVFLQSTKHQGLFFTQFSQGTAWEKFIFPSKNIHLGGTDEVKDSEPGKRVLNFFLFGIN